MFDLVRYVTESDPGLIFQFQSLHTQPKGSRAERDLWCAVFHQALIDYAYGRDKKADRHAPNLKEWISHNGEEVGTFRYVCDVISLDFTAVRKILENTTPYEMCVLLKKNMGVSKPILKKVVGE